MTETVVTSYHPDFLYCMECSSCTKSTDAQESLKMNADSADGNSNSTSFTNPTFSKPIHENNPSVISRSVFRVNGICCASEVTTIKNILRQINSSDLDRGLVSCPITKISVNITARLVYVEHDPLHLTAHDIANTLNKEGFETSIQSDGIQVEHLQKSRFVESTLIVPDTFICNARDIRQCFKANKYMPDQIRTFYFHPISKTIKVEHDPNKVSAATMAEKLSTSIRQGEYATSDWSIQVHIDGAIEGLSLPDSLNSERMDSMKNHWTERLLYLTPGLHWNVLFSGVFWVLSMIGEIFVQLDDLKFTGLVSVLFGLPTVALKAYRTLRRGHFDANCMMVLAAIGAAMLGEYEEAASVSFLFAISELLESRAASQAKEALDSIVHQRPDHAILIPDPNNSNNIVVVPTSCLQIGSLVSVRMGDKVPADGVVVEGQSYLDESSLTGEPTPILRSTGDLIYGGSINVGLTRLVIRTTKNAGDSAVSRLIRLVEDAQVNRSRTETMVDRFARVYTPIVFLLALSMCTMPWLLGREAGKRWMMNGLIIMVIACPCALTISTPVTYAAGLTAAAQRGIIVKGGCHLESLGNVKSVVLDKTGTMTIGKFRLVELVITCDRIKRREALELLAMMESHSSHPLSATLVNAALEEGVSIPKNVVVLNHTTIPGEGLTALIDNKLVFLGNMRLLERVGCSNGLSEEHKMRHQEWSQAGCTVGFLSIEGMGIIAMFCVSDILREETVDVVASLKTMGVMVMMITGDGECTARAVANEVGIGRDHVHSNCSPEEKMNHIQQLQGLRKREEISCGWQQNLVAMVGDGVNDVGALKCADVGIAMGEGSSSLAMEMSDVTFMDSNLLKLVFSLELGRSVVTIIRENIGLSVGSKLVVMVLTFYNRMTLLLAIASDIGIMLLVTLNGMRPLGRVKLFKSREALDKKHIVYDKLDVEDDDDDESSTK